KNKRTIQETGTYDYASFFLGSNPILNANLGPQGEPTRILMNSDPEFREYLVLNISDW
ncbi:39057_t:CDS:2, partial [Gigaspora margarita]